MKSIVQVLQISLILFDKNMPTVTILLKLMYLIALTIKGQNIGASTKFFCKQMFHFDTLDSTESKYKFFGSF